MTLGDAVHIDVLALSWQEIIVFAEADVEVAAMVSARLSLVNQRD
jgi:hypothetical protein